MLNAYQNLKKEREVIKNFIKEKIIKQISKIKRNPIVSKSMRNVRKGTKNLLTIGIVHQTV